MGPPSTSVSKLGFTLGETNAFYRIIFNGSNMLALDILTGIPMQNTILQILTDTKNRRLKDLEREFIETEAEVRKTGDKDTAKDLSAVIVILGLHIRPTKAFKENFTKTMRILALLVLHQNGHMRDRYHPHDYSFAHTKITMKSFEMYHALFNKLDRDDDPLWTQWKRSNTRKEKGEDVYFTPYAVTYEMKHLVPKAIDERMKMSNDVCAVCDRLYNGDNRLCRAPGCNHHFHDICIAPWLYLKSTCPLCQR